MFHITSKICMVKDVGLNGNLFGGNMLAWVDEASAIFASKYTGERVVTKFMTQIEFTAPVKEGSILDFYAKNPIVGDSSISFEVTVTNAMDGTVYLKVEVVFVAIDAFGVRKSILNKQRIEDITEAINSRGMIAPRGITNANLVLQYKAHISDKLPTFETSQDEWRF